MTDETSIDIKRVPLTVNGAKVFAQKFETLSSELSSAQYALEKRVGAARAIYREEAMAALADFERACMDAQQKFQRSMGLYVRDPDPEKVVEGRKP